MISEYVLFSLWRSHVCAFSSHEEQSEESRTLVAQGQIRRVAGTTRYDLCVLASSKRLLPIYYSSTFSATNPFPFSSCDRVARKKTTCARDSATAEERGAIFLKGKG